MRLVPLALAAALVMVGCTDDGTEGSTDGAGPAAEVVDPEAAITAMLTEGFTTSSPEQCSTLYTEKGLADALSTVDADHATNVATCEERTDPSAVARSVEVEVELLDERSANAVVTPDGGPQAGTAVHVSLVEQDGWRVDEFTRVELVDRALVDAQLGSAVQANVGSLYDQPVADCLQQRLGATPDEQVEQHLADGTTVDLVADGLVACLGNGVDSLAMFMLTDYQLRAAGLPDTFSGCASVGAMTEGITVKGVMTDAEVRQRWFDEIKTLGETCAAAGAGG
ncbi:hypothetical protein [Thalassiella azotivora]